MIKYMYICMYIYVYIYICMYVYTTGNWECPVRRSTDFNEFTTYVFSVYNVLGPGSDAIYTCMNSPAVLSFC